MQRRNFIKIETSRVKGDLTQDSGRRGLEVIERADRKVLGISNEAVILYENIESLESSEISTSRPNIYL
jgi:hypothetical protein